MADRDATQDKTTQAQLGETRKGGGKETGTASSGLGPGEAHPPSAESVTGGGAPAEPAGSS
jgi:hypothetical protein